jgi:hypothetical protein
MFDIVDVEDWSAKDFAHYLKAKLEDKGVNYEIKYPMDIILLSKLLTRNYNKGRTKLYIKNKIDQNFGDFEISSVNSLQFVFSMFDEIEPSQGSKKASKSSCRPSGPIQLSPGLKDRLKALNNAKI